MASTKKKTNTHIVKEVVILIEYRVWTEDIGEIGPGLENLRQTGSAEIIDVRLEENKETS